MTCRRRVMATCVRTLGGALLAAAAALATAEEAGVEYARLMADADSLERYNAQREKILESQQAEIASLEAQVAGLAETGLAVQPLLQRMFGALAEFVANDLPFLSEERRDRIDRLEEIMAGESPIAEKFRRLMEAYRIELEYGRAMAAYRGTLPDGRAAQFVHIGRVTLLYRTDDGSEGGYWDAEARQWVADSSYFRAISDAIAMANEEVTPDLLAVPVPAAAETRS
ncbi:MAG TPA: DUF3450 domain-containing protein [Pseudomonadales bacterium]